MTSKNDSNSVDYAWSNIDSVAVQAGSDVATPYCIPTDTIVFTDAEKLAWVPVGKWVKLDLSRSKHYERLVRRRFLDVNRTDGKAQQIWQQLTDQQRAKAKGKSLLDFLQELHDTEGPAFRAYDIENKTPHARWSIVNILLDYWENTEYRSAALSANFDNIHDKKLPGFAQTLGETVHQGGESFVPASAPNPDGVDQTLVSLLAELPTAVDVSGKAGENTGVLPDADYLELQTIAIKLRELAKDTRAVIDLGHAEMTRRLKCVASVEALKVLTEQCAEGPLFQPPNFSIDPEKRAVTVALATRLAETAHRIAFDLPLVAFVQGDYRELAPLVENACQNLKYILFRPRLTVDQPPGAEPLSTFDFPSDFQTKTLQVFKKAFERGEATTPHFQELVALLADAMLWSLDALAEYGGTDDDRSQLASILQNLPNGPAKTYDELVANRASALEVVLALVGAGLGPVCVRAEYPTDLRNDPLSVALTYVYSVWCLPHAAASREEGGRGGEVSELGETVLKAMHAVSEEAEAGMREAWNDADAKKLVGVFQKSFGTLVGEKAPKGLATGKTLLKVFGFMCELGVAAGEAREERPAHVIVFSSLEMGLETVEVGFEVVEASASLLGELATEHAAKAAAKFPSLSLSILGVVGNIFAFDRKQLTASWLGIASSALSFAGEAASFFAFAEGALATTGAVLGWLGALVALAGFVVNLAMEHELEPSPPNLLALSMIETMKEQQFLTSLERADETFPKDMETFEANLRLEEYQLPWAPRTDAVRQALAAAGFDEKNVEVIVAPPPKPAGPATHPSFRGDT